MTVSMAVSTASAGTAAPHGPMHAQDRVARQAATGGSLSATPTAVYTGDRVRFSGWLVRGKMNQKAILQVWRDGDWRRADMDYTNRRGQFVHKTDMDYPAGTYRFRVLGKPSRLYEVPQVITRTVRVSIKDRPGSQALPWRPGQWFSVQDWRIALGVTTSDAWPVLQSQNSYADPPPPGWAYIAVPLAFQRTGAGSGKAWIENDLDFVGGDGVVYDSSTEVNGTDYYCSLDNDWSDAPELYTGASATGTECLLVRQSALPGGLWRFEGAYEDPYQFITLN